MPGMQLGPNASTAAILGVLSFLIAGFVLGMGEHSSDPELVGALALGLMACGLLGVLSAAVAFGIRLARD
jgi:ABC-type multidrug transport system permease subunit